MIFEGKTVTVLGGHGFIGSALIKRLQELGATVVSTPTKDSVAVYHFASYTHLPFEKNPAYHTHEMVSSLLHLFPFCKENNIPLIYPSSALVYEAPRPFYWFKKMLEEMQFIYEAKSCAVRIFPVFGVGEGERGHPTAIYQWVKAMTRGENPIVFGDGTQRRSFTFIEDVAAALTSERIVGIEKPTIEDVGAGEMYTFNEIIGLINQVLIEKKILIEPLPPIYNDAPQGYAQGVACPNPIISTPMKEAIAKMVDELRPC